MPWKVVRDQTSDFVADLGHLKIEICNEGYLMKQKKSAHELVLAQATVGGGDLFTKLLILPLNPRGLFVSLCRSTSTYVGALKFPLTCLTSGRGLVCEFARSFVESGSFPKLLAELRSPAS